MRQKILNAIGLAILGSLLVLLSGVTGGPVRLADQSSFAVLAGLSR